MAGKFSQIYIQLVFAVKGRDNLIDKSWNKELHKYIAGIIKGKGQKPIIVNGMPDHIHAFVGLRPAMAISDLARDVKNNSSNFINAKKFLKKKGGRGRKASVAFLIHILILAASTITSLIRKSIIRKKHLRKNTLNS